MISNIANPTISRVAANKPVFNTIALGFIWLPLIVSESLSSSPGLSWTIAWLSSVAILILSLAGKIVPIPNDLSIYQQALRPSFLINIIFVGFTFISSVFYWLDLNGITFGLADSFMKPENDLLLAAQAQRLYLLAHIAFVYGLAFSSTRETKNHTEVNYRGDIVLLLLILSCVALMMAYAFSIIPGMFQLYGKSKQLCIVSIAVSLGLAYENKSPWIMVSIILNGLLMVLALASGWKEEVLVLVLLIASTFFRRHPVLTSSAVVLVFVVATWTLPNISANIRTRSWYGDEDRFSALNAAVADTATMSWREVNRNAWGFLTDRASEFQLFTLFLEKTPGLVDYEGFSLLEKAALAPIPRILWSEKPDLEKQAMERTKSRGVVAEGATVSAKPQFVVDSYLAGGPIVVFLAMFTYGWICNFASQFCERRFGGYLFGGIAFNGLFGILWRGNCWEFLTNAIVWSFVFLYVLEFLMRQATLLMSTRRNTRHWMNSNAEL